MPLTPEAQAVANRGWRIIGDEDPEFLANLLAGHLSRSAAPLRGAALTYANELRGKIERAEKLTRERRLREHVAAVAMGRQAIRLPAGRVDRAQRLREAELRVQAGAAKIARLN
jgi:hypothetical protein